HRGDAAAFAIHECEGCRHRQWQRRLADHPWQCGHRSGARGEHPGERERLGDQGEYDRFRPDGAVGENARCRIGDPDRKDTAYHFGRSVCDSLRGIALLLAVQSLRYRDLSLPDRTSGTEDRVEGGASLNAAVRQTGHSAAAVAAAPCYRYSRDRTAVSIPSCSIADGLKEFLTRSRPPSEQGTKAPIEASQRQLRCRDPTARNSVGPRVAGRSHSPANLRI